MNSMYLESEQKERLSVILHYYHLLCGVLPTDMRPIN